MKKYVWIVEKADNFAEFQPMMFCFLDQSSARKFAETQKEKTPGKYRVMRYSRVDLH